MKKGFTLTELLVVIALMAIIGFSAFAIFGQSNDNTMEEDLRNKYKQIQKAAILYVDLNDSWLMNFTSQGEVYLKVGVLQEENYISGNMINPVTGDLFPSSNLVKIYKTSLIENDPNAYINTCIISNEGGNTNCIANSEGYPCGCCDYEITNYNPACSN